MSTDRTTSPKQFSRAAVLSPAAAPTRVATSPGVTAGYRFADLAIQRKVGFEFETGVGLAARSAPPPDPAYKIPYGVQVFESSDAGWQIKSDNSKVEFVTKEVEEDDAGAVRVAAVMGEVTSWARAMAALTQSAKPAGTGKVADVRPSAGTAKQYQGRDPVIHNAAIAEGAVTAAPQASGGVTLEKIPALVDKLVNVKLTHLTNSRTFKPQHAAPAKTDDEEENAFNAEFHAKQLGMFTGQGYDTSDISYSVGAESLFTLQYVTSAKHAVIQWIAQFSTLDSEERGQFATAYGFEASSVPEHSQKLQGLLTLVISYLFGGHAASRPVPYTKAIATLMSRTNIASLYATLSPLEKKLFTDEEIEYISGLAPNEPLFRGGFITYTPTKQKIVDPGPTRKAWIDSIILGTPPPTPQTGRIPADLLSQASGSSAARNSASLGAFDTPDINPRTRSAELAVLEIRNIPKNQAIDDWTQTALTIFELFRALKETPQETDERHARDRAQQQRLVEDASKARESPFAYRY